MKTKFFPMTHYEYVMTTDLLDMPGVLKEIKNHFSNEDIGFQELGLFMTNTFNQRLSSIAKYMSLSTGSVGLQMIYHVYQEHLHGEKIYYLSKNLVEMFAHTAMNVSSDLIQSPFQAIYIYIDQNDLILKDYTGTAPIKGVYVNLREESGGSRKLRIMATTGVEGLNNFTDINFFFNLNLWPGKVDELVEEHLDQMLKGELASERDLFGNHEIIPALTRLVINSLLYITSKNPDLEKITPPKINMGNVKSKRKQQKLEKRLTKVAQKSFILIGGKTPRMTTANGKIVSDNSKINYQFTVAGHWRAQWKGSRSDGSWRQEQVWIKPYIKGKDLAESINKRYIIT